MSKYRRRIQMHLLDQTDLKTLKDHFRNQLQQHGISKSTLRELKQEHGSGPSMKILKQQPHVQEIMQSVVDMARDLPSIISAPERLDWHGIAYTLPDVCVHHTLADKVLGDVFHEATHSKK